MKCGVREQEVRGGMVENKQTDPDCCRLALVSVVTDV